MRQVFAVALLAVMSLGLLAGQEQSRTTTDTSAEIRNQILQKENEQNDALLKNDADMLANLCADQLAWTNASGVLLSKAEMLADISSGKQRNATMHHDDIQLHIYATTVVVTGTSTSNYTYNGKQSKGVRRFTNVWIRDGETWKLAVHHVTPIVQ
jgi:hypothetical protein